MVLHVSLSPWFQGIDCVFEGIAIIVALLLTFYAYELYSFSKIREYKFFSLAFLAIAGSFFFKILTHVSFYITQVQHIFLGVAKIALTTPHKVHVAFLLSAFAWRALFLAGFLLYYALLDKARNKRQLFLSIYLAAVVAALSIYQDFMFYITAAIILGFIVHILHANSKKWRTRQTKIVALSFLLILAAQVSFIFVSLHKNIYLLGQILQLAGFGLLLVNYISLMRKKS